MTGVPPEAFTNQAGKINARSIIAKPIPLEVLYDTVKAYCGDAALPA